MLVLRIALAALLFGGGVAFVDWYFETDMIGAIGRLLLWFWRGLVQFLARIAGMFSSSLAASVRTLAQRTVVRRIMRPLWRFFAVAIALFLLGQIRTDKIEDWTDARRLWIIEWSKQALHFKPQWPRGVRATIAFAVIIFLIWAFVWISEHVGTWWGLGASIVFWELVKYVRVIGFDALASWATEKWAPVKAFIERHAWIRWLWLGPVFSWIFASIENLKEKHGSTHDGRSSLEMWRAKRRARRILERNAH